LSPLVVHTSSVHDELKHLSQACITRHHANHYLGFANSQWRLFSKEEVPRVKPLLYVFRVVLTGIHLMNTGRIEANLNVLNEEFKLDFLPELIALKHNNKEQSALDAANLPYYESEFNRLLSLLETTAAASKLPDAPTAKPALDELLRRVRLSLR
jgi:hypothetical protein